MRRFVLCQALAAFALFAAVDVSAVSAQELPASAIVTADVGPGVYEIVYSPVTHSVFVATIGSFGDGKGGTILRLDDQTLAVEQRIESPKKAFALAIDNRAGILYAGLTLDGGIAAIDVATGTLRGILDHGVKNAEGKPVHTRQIVVDEASGKVMVSGITEGGFIWVIDGASFTSERIVQDSNAPTAGLTLDLANHQLIASGTAAYAVFDTETWQKLSENRIPERLIPGEGLRRFLINTALDDSGHLFANQLNNGEGTLVFDFQTGALLQTIPTGEMPVGIRLNSARNEVYVASHESGPISIIDAQSFTIKRTLPLPPHPNTLALSPDGKILFVSLKQPFVGEGQPIPSEQVVRIQLDEL